MSLPHGSRDRHGTVALTSQQKMHAVMGQGKKFCQGKNWSKNLLSKMAIYNHLLTYHQYLSIFSVFSVI